MDSLKKAEASLPRQSAVERPSPDMTKRSWRWPPAFAALLALGLTACQSTGPTFFMSGPPPVKCPLDPSTVATAPQLAGPSATPLKGSAARIRALATLGVANREKDAQTGLPVLTMTNAVLELDAPIEPTLIQIWTRDVTGPFHIEVDGQSHSASTMVDLAKASFAEAKVYWYREPGEPGGALFVAGNWQTLAFGGQTVQLFGACFSDKLLFRSPWSNGRRQRGLDGAWYGSGFRVIGTKARTVDSVLVHGVAPLPKPGMTIALPADLLNVSVALWETDPANPAQGTLVHEEAVQWGTTMNPISSHKFEVPFKTSVTLLPGKEYRLMFLATAMNTSGDAPNYWQTFDHFRDTRGPFPGQAGAFEVLDAYREEAKVFPKTKFVSAGTWTLRALPWIGITTK